MTQVLATRSPTHKPPCISPDTAPSSPDNVDDSLLRLFVGCIPYDVTEEQLKPIFDEYGVVEDLAVGRDEQGESLCYCFVRYASRSQHEAAIESLHGNFYMGQMVIPLQVRFLEPEVGEYKIFVGGLPPDMTPEELRFHLAMQYGPICDIHMLKKTGHIAYGAAFVKFLYKSSADQLIEDATVQSVYLPSGEFSDSVRASIAVSSRPFNVSTPAVYYGNPIERPDTVYGQAMSQRQRVYRPSVCYPEDASNFSPVKLFVGCLPYSKTAPEVAGVFEQFGPLVEVAILTDPDGRSRGAAFVTFLQREHAMEALASLVGYVFPNSTRPINISLAHKQTVAGLDGPQSFGWYGEQSSSVNGSPYEAAHGIAASYEEDTEGLVHD